MTIFKGKRFRALRRKAIERKSKSEKQLKEAFAKFIDAAQEFQKVTGNEKSTMRHSVFILVAQGCNTKEHKAKKFLKTFKIEII